MVLLLIFNTIGKYNRPKTFKKLQTETLIYYYYRFEAIPLIHHIFPNMLTCESKLTSHREGAQFAEQYQGLEACL